MTETQLRQKYIQGLLDIEGKCAEGGVYAVSLDGNTAVSGSDAIISGATYTIINWGG